MQGARRLDEPDRRARRAADEVRPLARRPLRRATSRRSRCWPALWRARRDGVGCDCDVSLFETALHELMYVGTWAATEGYVPRRDAALGAPVDRPVPDLRDRRRLDRRRLRQAEVLGAALPTRSAGRTCADDPRFADFAGARPPPRRAAADPRGRVRRRARPRSGSSALGAARRPVRAGQRRRRGARRPAGAARGDVVEIEHPRFGDRAPGRVAAAGRRPTETAPLARAPRSAASTPTRCCASCAATPERVAELRADGVFG